MYGRAKIYFNAQKDLTGPLCTWYCPLHRLDYTHPLLLDLQFAADEIAGRDSFDEDKPVGDEPVSDEITGESS